MPPRDLADAPLPPGVSAEARQAALRTRAELAELGPRGERATDALLAPLRTKGFVVLRDAAVPRSRVVIDHVVVGPTGVFVVDSRRWETAELVRQAKGRLFSGPLYRGEEVDRVWWARGKVVAEAGLDHLADLEVTALLCIHDARFETDVVELDTAVVASPRALTYAILRGERSLSPEATAAVARAVMAAFPPKHGGAWADLAL